MAQDMEAFAVHAKRKTVNTDDVLLVVRRNPPLVRAGLAIDRGRQRGAGLYAGA
jgi:hypothetical protein